jgi:hypothetical protein
MSWLPAVRLPAGSETFAAASARSMSATVMPCTFIRSGSMVTRTTRSGPPSVTTSRVPATRLISTSTAWATLASARLLASGRSLYSVSATIGTSSMPLGLTIGSPTPTCGLIQSRLAISVSCRRTSAAMRSSPTLNCTVRMARPGRVTENTCSMPVICEMTCSAGTVTMLCTSSLAAPGNGISTLAIVTLICGSSSFGVTSTAKTPISRPTSAISGVICVVRKARAMRPEMPSVPPAP